MVREIRKYFTWIFAFTALVCVSISFTLTPKMLHHNQNMPPLSLGWQIFLAVAPWLFPTAAIVFSMACWTSYKEKPSATIWGILASLINVLVALFPVLIPPHSILNAFLLILAIGVTGLVVYARPTEKTDRAPERQQSTAVSGDGTSNLLNGVGPLFSLIAGSAAFFWWLGWMRAKEVPWHHNNAYLTFASILIMLLIIAVHECGHAAVGWALGMKLRAFMVGPVQWSIRDGRWHFHFAPSQILAESGGTGLVPTVVKFPRWAHVAMLFGGVFTNLITSAVALLFATTDYAGATLQGDGFLALFGAWSLALAVVNLIPFRAQNGYSDGAQIYQWLANGPWADLHRAFGIAGATLVTPLRPRDYDMDVIARASKAINQGPHALTLRLLAYWHFLDQDKTTEAGEALANATQIYNESASTAPVGLLAVFVFGAAYIWRNPEAARIWWKRFQDTNPLHFDAEYWLAASAQNWMEGKLDEAYHALAKADLLSQQLPNAGAYEFERYCCFLLREALTKERVAGL